MVNTEKYVTYFYNELIPVNRMQYIKFSVYSTLRNSGFCRRSVAHYSIALSQHIFKKVIYKFTFLWNSSKQGTNIGSHQIWHTYTLCPSFGRAKNRQQRSWFDHFAGQVLLWQLLSRKSFVAAALVLPICLGVVQSWHVPASSIKFLSRRSLISRWVYLPHMK